MSVSAKYNKDLLKQNSTLSQWLYKGGGFVFVCIWSDSKLYYAFKAIHALKAYIFSCVLKSETIFFFLFIRAILVSMGEGNGTPLQYSCLENPMDRGAWQAAVHGVTKSRTRLSDLTFIFLHWGRKWQPTPVFLPGEPQGWGSLVGCCLWGCTESDTTEATLQQ